MLAAGVFVIACLARGPLSLSATGAGAAAGALAGWFATKRFLDRLPVAAVGGAVGAAYAVTLATGRYDDLVGELYRIATNT